MLLRHMEYMVALSRERHFGRAAAACKVTQPALSSALKALETELGTPIVQRHQRFEGFTPEGERIIEWCRRILADRGAMLRELETFRSGLSGRVRLGIAPSAVPLASLVARRFRETHPNVQFEIARVRHDQMHEELNNFEVDAVITLMTDEVTRFASRTLFMGHMVAVLTAESDLIRGATISWAKAGALPLCLLARHTAERRAIDASFRASHVNPEPILEADSIFDLVLHILEGDCITILPQWVVQLIPAAMLTRTVVLTAPETPCEISLLWVDISEPAPLSKALIALIETLQEGGEIARFLNTGRIFFPSQAMAKSIGHL